MEIESRTAGAWGWGRENGESVFNADGLSTWGNENVLETHSGDSRLMCALKMVQTVIYMLGVLCHNFKEREQTFEQLVYERGLGRKEGSGRVRTKSTSRPDSFRILQTRHAVQH